MAIDKRFLYYTSEAGFLSDKNGGNISDSSIAFISVGGKKAIYTHGVFFSSEAFVVGTQTAATNVFTGTLNEIEKLYDGLSIKYWLPENGTTSNATLNLNINGTQTGAIPVYIKGTTRFTNHIGKYNVLHLTYRENVGSIAKGWWVLGSFGDKADGNTKYSFTSGTDGSFKVKASDESAEQTISIGKPEEAGTADVAKKVEKAFTLQVNSGSTEYEDLYTFDGSTAKTINIKQGSNIKIETADGEFSISGDYSAASQGAAGLISSDDKTKLDYTNIAYGTCSTAAATAAKEITISGNSKWSLTAGSVIVIKFSYTNTASNPTFNVNGTGAKSVWYNTALITTGSLGMAGTANRPMQFMYDGTQFVFVGWSYDTNSTYSTYSLGIGYGTCATAANTAAKVVTLSNYSLVTGGIVSVKFDNNVPASATMNINSKGAKAIYHRGAAIAAGVIEAGDIATFIYSTNYHLIAIDRATSKATQSVDGLMSSEDKTKLDGIATGATANKGTVTSVTISAGDGITVDSTAAITTSGTRTISLSESGVTVDSSTGTKTYGSTAQQSPGHSDTFNIPYFTVDKYGRITAASTATVKLPASGNTDEKVKQSSSSDNAELPLLVGTKTNPTSGTAYEAYYNTGVTMNPSTKTITATIFSGNSTSATKLQDARTIDGVDFNGTAAITHYGTCSTAAATAAKTVALTGFKLVTGSRIAIKFTVTNSASSPTLNVNSTGAKAIVYRGSAISAGYLAANRVYEFVYDGTDYELIGDINTDTNTKVTSEANHYTPGEDSSSELSVDASSSTAATWGSTDLVTGVNIQRDSKGHVTGVTVDSVKIPANPNSNTYTSAYCSTAAGTAAKTATCTNYVLTSKTYLHITITNANSAASALTLNVNSKGAKTIYINGTVSSSSNYTLPAGTYLVYYDGTYYHFRTDGVLPGKIVDASTVSGKSVSTSISSSSEDTTIPTSKAVYTAIYSGIKANDAMIFKGTLGTSANGGTISALPASHKVGDTYRVVTKGSYAGVNCEVGDLIICITTGTTANNAHWTVAQTNIDGAVTGPTSSTGGHIAVFNGTSGKVIEDSGKTIADLTYTSGTGLSLSNNTFSLESSGVTVDSSTGTKTYGSTTQQTPSHGGTFNIPYYTVDTYGRITSAGVTTVKLPGSGNTDTKVNVTLETTSKAYLIGVKTTPTSTATAMTAVSDTEVYLDSTAGQLVAKTFKGALSGNASSATYATNIRVTATTDAKTYYPMWTTGTAADTNYVLRGNSNFRYNIVAGTASAQGYDSIYLGNSTASGTAGNSTGRILLYSSSSSYHTIIGAATSSTVAHTLPATAGTILNTGTTGITQTVKSGTEIASIKINNTSTKIYAPSIPSVSVTDEGTGTFVSDITSSNHTITVTRLDSGKGSTTKPVYFDSTGVLTECTTYAGGTKVILNGSAKGGTTASFYAPTAVGTEGQVLVSDGSGAPSWQDCGGKINSATASVAIGTSWGTLLSATKLDTLCSSTVGTYVIQVYGPSSIGYNSGIFTWNSANSGDDNEILLHRTGASTNIYLRMTADRTLQIAGSAAVSSSTITIKAKRLI